MAKKKKGGKKKKGSKKKEPEVVVRDEFDDMDLECLTEEVKRATAKLNEIRRNRNYYLIERDQVQQFYEIVNEEVTKTESHIRNIESQMEKMQDTHRNDIRIYLQKVIHLEYEHANNVDFVQNMGEKERADEEAKHYQIKTENKKSKLQLKQELRVQEAQTVEKIKNAKEREQKEIKIYRDTFEENHQKLIESYETRLRELMDDLELRRKMEIHEIEERKNRHINDLMAKFEHSFTEMRTYYNSITQDNLALIKSLNDEIYDLKVKHAQNEKAMEEIERKNAMLSEPLEATQKEVKKLELQLQNFDKDKASLKHARNRLAAAEELSKDLAMKQNRLGKMYEEVTNECKTLYETFENTVTQVQSRSNSKNVVLEKWLEEYRDIFEVKKAQFTSVLRASNLDPVVLQNVTKKLDDVLSSKHDQIGELKYEIAKIQKAHDDLVRVYESKLAELGVPRDELGLVPLFNQSGTAPADLICV
jgi:hypothetical protein